MKLYCLLLEIFVVSLILSLLQTPVADWPAMGLNLCNSVPFNPTSAPMLPPAVPSVGPQLQCSQGVSAPCLTDALTLIPCGLVSGAPVDSHSPEGWPTTSNPVPRGTTR